VLRDVGFRLYVKYMLVGVSLQRLPLSNYILLININFASGEEQKKIPRSFNNGRWENTKLKRTTRFTQF